MNEAPRPTHRQHTPAQYLADIKRAAAPGTIFFDWLTDIRQESNYQDNQTKRDEAEGMRKLAETIQNMALSEEIKEADNAAGTTS